MTNRSAAPPARAEFNHFLLKLNLGVDGDGTFAADHDILGRGRARHVLSEPHPRLRERDPKGLSLASSAARAIATHSSAHFR